MNLNQLIKRPILTEKSMQLAANQNYTFAVDKKANKAMIAQAIKELFSVDPISVRIIKVAGKRRRFGKYRRAKQLPDWKKAIVKIKSDQKIDLFELEGKK